MSEQSKKEIRELLETIDKQLLLKLLEALIGEQTLSQE